MKMNTKWLTVAVATVALSAALVGQSKAPILHPEMTPVGDTTYKKPMGKIGQKTGGWTATTTAAGVDSKPQPGKEVTVVGEVVDFSCYLQLGKHGEKHRSCGQKCAKAGQPVGLLTADGSLYMLMTEEHDPRRDGLTNSFQDAAAGHMAHIMEVTGVQTEHGGYKAIYVAGFVKQ